jgi:hypothetical protein
MRASSVSRPKALRERNVHGGVSARCWYPASTRAPWGRRFCAAQ